MDWTALKGFDFRNPKFRSVGIGSKRNHKFRAFQAFGELESYEARMVDLVFKTKGPPNPKHKTKGVAKFEKLSNISKDDQDSVPETKLELAESGDPYLQIPFQRLA